MSKRLALGAAAVLILAACTSAIVPPPKSADYYFQEGERLFEKELYQEAITNWEKVRDSFYSPELTALAELKIAEAHFLAGHYLEAAAAYEDFLKQHPDHEQTPQILFQLGMSYFHQMLSPDRDQTATRAARATFENLLKRFPDFARAEEARGLVRQARDRLAAHEVYVGRFYLRTREYRAAVDRLEDAVRRFPEYRRRDELLYYLGLAHLRAGDRQATATAFNTLFQEFPDSKYVPEAQKALAKEY